MYCRANCTARERQPPEQRLPLAVCLHLSLAATLDLAFTRPFSMAHELQIRSFQGLKAEKWNFCTDAHLCRLNHLSASTHPLQVPGAGGQLQQH